MGFQRTKEMSQCVVYWWYGVRTRIGYDVWMSHPSTSHSFHWSKVVRQTPPFILRIVFAYEPQICAKYVFCFDRPKNPSAQPDIPIVYICKCTYINRLINKNVSLPISIIMNNGPRRIPNEIRLSCSTVFLYVLPLPSRNHQNPEKTEIGDGSMLI